MQRLDAHTNNSGRNLNYVKKCPLDSPIFLSVTGLEEKAERTTDALADIHNSDILQKLSKALPDSYTPIIIPYREEALEAKEPVLVLTSKGLSIAINDRLYPLTNHKASMLLTLSGCDADYVYRSCEKMLTSEQESNLQVLGAKENETAFESSGLAPSKADYWDRNLRKAVNTIEAFLRDKAIIRYLCRGSVAALSPEWCSLHQKGISGIFSEEAPSWEKIPHLSKIFSDDHAPDNMHVDRIKFINQAFELGDRFYLKPTNYSSGEGVLRIEKVGEDSWQVTTDCLKAGYAFQFHERQLNRDPLGFSYWLLRSTSSMYANFFLHPDYHHASRVHSTENLKGIIDSFLRGSKATHPHWIAEREIDGARWHGQKTELRCVFRPLESEGAFHLLGHYMKVSGKSVAGNISQGGRAWESEYVYVGMLSKLLNPNQQLSKIRQLAKSEMCSALSDAEDTLNSFLNRVAETCAIDGFEAATVAAHVGPMMYQVGVDFIPVWNEAQSKFDNYLMELQSGCGVSGLKKVNKHTWNHLERKPRYRAALN